MTEATTIPTRDDAELERLAEAMEEAGLPELGKAQGRLFDAVAFGLVYQEPDGVNWREDGEQAAKAGLLVPRVERKQLIALGRAVAGRKPWGLTALGERVDAIRNPGRAGAAPVTVVEPEAAVEPVESERAGAVVVGGTVVARVEHHELPAAESAPVMALTGEVSPDPDMDGAIVGPVSLVAVLAADSPLGRAVQGGELEHLVGLTREGVEAALGALKKPTLHLLVGEVGVKMPKAASGPEMVNAIMVSSFPRQDDGARLAEDSTLVRMVRQMFDIDLSGEGREHVAAQMDTLMGRNDLQHVAGALSLSLPKAATKIRLITAIVEKAFG